ncbi:hypothetical protein [Clostridium baratii]|uniref:Uncharacterized protein n=1 Tax=Clostridium baratii TaxID=1561 RepID=A0A174QPB9_9CLOT|nr:hypothetical protein [Clostridium baratii]CUP75094.1 Uncharacterised protein [Clostridium baratii]
MSIIKKEFELYGYIERYLSKRGIVILQNEVEFMFALKAVDLLALGKNGTYYLIEVKKDTIKKDDYYNLLNIINNNNSLFLKGILFGKNNKSLINELNNNENIELVTFDESFYIKNKEKIFYRYITSHKSYWNKDKKYIRYCLKNLVNINIIELDFYYNGIYMKFTEEENLYEYIGNAINLGIRGRLISYEESYHRNIAKEIYNNISLSNLQGHLLKIRGRIYSNYSNKISQKSAMELNNIYESLKYLFKYIKRRDFFKHINNDNEIILWSKNENIIKLYFFNEYKVIMINSDYLYIIKLNELDYIDDVLTNELSYIEFNNIEFNNILYKPYIEVEYGDSVINLKLTIEVKDDHKKKKFKREYKVDKYKTVIDPRFYLMINYNIILDYQIELKKFLDDNKRFVISNRYINNYANELRKNILKNNRKKVISIKRQILDYIERCKKIRLTVFP